MSLVNDMLRDLEQRNEKPAEVPGNQPNVKAAQYVEQEEINRAPKFALLGVGLVAVVAAIWFISQNFVSTESQPKITVTDGADANKRQVVVEPKAVQAAQPAIAEVKAELEAQNNAEPETVPTPVEGTPVDALPSVAAIEQIKWAGADFGGDLVVRLSGEADIQVVSQRDNVIVIGFDNVKLKTALPMISSPLIQRLDLNKEDDRTLLTLTTQLQSQFAFRVQQNPTTLVLGVIPDQPVVINQPEEELPSEVESAASVDEVAEVTDENEPDPASSDTPVFDQLQVTSVEPKENQVVASKPVSKAKTLLTDKQTVTRAQRLINQGELTKAEDLLRSAIQQRPAKVVGARGLLATLLLSTGDTAEAQRLIQQSRELHPTDSVLKKLQARIWLNAGRNAEASQLLQESKPAMSKDPEYYELLATAYQQQAMPEATARIYYQLLQLNNQVPRWWVGMGYALEQAQRYPDARNAYQSGVQIPSIAPSLKNYARQRIQALAGR